MHVLTDMVASFAQSLQEKPNQLNDYVEIGCPFDEPAYNPSNTGLFVEPKTTMYDEQWRKEVKVASGQNECTCENYAISCNWCIEWEQKKKRIDNTQNK